MIRDRIKLLLALIFLPDFREMSRITSDKNIPDPKTPEEALANMQEIGDQLREFRKKYPQSMLSGTAFNLQCFAGEMEAAITIKIEADKDRQ